MRLYIFINSLNTQILNQFYYECTLSYIVSTGIKKKKITHFVSIQVHFNYCYSLYIYIYIYYRFIVRFPIGLDFPFITLPFQGC